MATELELRDQLGLMGITHEIQWLLHLDEIWTRWLAAPDLSKDDKTTLADVGTTMEQMLASVTLKDRIVAVGHAAGIRRDAAAATVQAIFRSHPQLQVGAVRNLAFPDGFEEFLDRQLSDLVQTAPEAIDQLSSKTLALRSGEWTPGDLAPQMLCLLLAILAGNGAMLSLKDKDAWYGIAVGALKDLAGLGCGFF